MAAPEREQTREQAELVDFLRHPQNYPETTTAVEVRETHLSWLFLTDHYVYKLKKPLRYRFLDFSTLNARLHNCQTEVRINSELAPSVYLCVLPLSRDRRQGLNLAAQGEPVDYLVKMRRLPAAWNLEARLKAGTLDAGLVDRAARKLARFYARQPVAGVVSVETLAHGVSELTGELDTLPVDCGTALGTLDKGLQQALESHAQALGQRPLVEVHGDLRPEHVYLGKQPEFIDRLEFNARLRCMDPLEELSFFAMECQRLGAGWVGVQFIEAYRHVATDVLPDALVGVYTGYRALLWAVLSARHLERDDHRRPWADISRDYLHRGCRALGV